MLPLAHSSPRPEEHREVLTFTNQALLRDILAVSPQLAELGQLNDLSSSQAAVRLAILNPHVEIDNVALARLLSHFFGSPSNPEVAEMELRKLLSNQRNGLETPTDVTLLVSPELLEKPDVLAERLSALHLLHGDTIPVRLLIGGKKRGVPAFLANVLNGTSDYLVFEDDEPEKGSLFHKTAAHEKQFNEMAIQKRIAPAELAPNAEVYFPEGYMGDGTATDPRLENGGFIPMFWLDHVLERFKELADLIANQA